MNSRSKLTGCALLAAIVCGLTPVRADEVTKLLPEQFALCGPEARQSLLLESFSGTQADGQIVDGVAYTSSDPTVAKIEDGVAVPVSNGTAMITGTSGQRSAAAEVAVTAMDQPFAWSFRNHVESVLSKASCNTGACHGALAGKNGFKLSLGAFDPQSDYFYITRQARARRVVLSDPGRSLVLTKPTGAVPHKGGLRFRTDSYEYRVLSEWIADGANGPRDDDPRLERLEILPGASVLKKGARQQLIVRAYFTDGHAEDVTRWARFTSSNESVSKIDDQGMVSVIGHGEASIKAWYLSQNVMATVSVGYEQAVDPAVFAEAPRKNFIDELVLAKLESLNVPPSPPATDAEFLRRAFLDTIGVLPTVEETRAFLADESSDKRDKLVDALLARPQFVDYWAYKWSDLLLVNSEKLTPAAMWAYYHWIRNQVAADTPWDDSARRLSRPPAARWKTARPTSMCCTRIRPTWPRRFRWPFWECRSIARSATTIRWRNGPTISTTAWRTSSRACARKKRAAQATAWSMRSAVENGCSRAPASRNRPALSTASHWRLTTKRIGATRWPTG